MKIVTFADVLSTDIDIPLMSDITDFEDAVVDAVATRIGAAMIIARNDKAFNGAKTSVVVTPETYVHLTQVKFKLLLLKEINLYIKLAYKEFDPNFMQVVLISDAENGNLLNSTTSSLELSR